MGFDRRDRVPADRAFAARPISVRCSASPAARVRVERDAVEADQADAQAVDAIDGRDDLVAERVDHRIVQSPVDGLGGIEQCRRDAARRPLDDVAMRGLQRVELGVGGVTANCAVASFSSASRNWNALRTSLTSTLAICKPRCGTVRSSPSASSRGMTSRIAPERQAGQRGKLALRHELPGRIFAARSCCWKRSYACQRSWRGGSARSRVAVLAIGASYH